MVSKNAKKIFIPITITIVLLLILISKTKWHDIFTLLKEANWWVAIFGISLSFLYPLCGAKRWQKILEAFGVEIDFKYSLSLTLSVFVANIVMPTRTGDFIKLYFMRKKSSYHTITSAIITELIIVLLSVGLLGLAGAMITDQPVYIFICGLVLLLVIFAIFSVMLLSRITFIGKFKQFFSALQNCIGSWRKSRYLIFVGFLWSILSWLLIFFQIMIFYKAFNVNISFIIVMTLLPIIILLTLIPISFSGLGIREVGFGYLFLSYASFHCNVMVSLLYFLASYLLLGAMSAFYLLLTHAKALIPRKQEINNESFVN